MYSAARNGAPARAPGRGRSNGKDRRVAADARGSRGRIRCGAGLGVDACVAPRLPADFRRTDDVGLALEPDGASRHDGQARVEDGVLVLQPHPFGQGGLLLTDKVYQGLRVLPGSRCRTRATTAASSCDRPKAARPTRSSSSGLATPGRCSASRCRCRRPEYIGAATDINTRVEGRRVELDAGPDGGRSAAHHALDQRHEDVGGGQMPQNDQIGGRYGGHDRPAVALDAPPTPRRRAVAGRVCRGRSSAFATWRFKELNVMRAWLAGVLLAALGSRRRAARRSRPSRTPSAWSSC